MQYDSSMDSRIGLGLFALTVACSPSVTGVGSGAGTDDEVGSEDTTTETGTDSEEGNSGDTEGESTETDTGDDGPVGPEEATYCDGAISGYVLPDDPAERGPWPVGARTIDLAGLKTEIWYPAPLGTEREAEPHVYDLREHLPNGGEGIDESPTFLQACDCYHDVPLDTEHGPYPVILFIHGFSGFRGQSLEFMTHWASRGFVVVSADHPSIGLRTFLEDGLGGIVVNILFGGGLDGLFGNCDIDTAGGQTEEAVAMLDELQQTAGALAFLDGHVDLTRMGAAGHSAGGGAIAPLAAYPNMRVIAPMSMNGVCDGPEVESSLVLGAVDDAIIQYSQTQDGFDTTPTPKRLVGLSNAGHMAFTSFCPIGADEGGILQAAQNAGVMFDPLFLALVGPLATDGCGDDSLAPEVGWEVTNYATAAAFEEVLLCLPERADALNVLQVTYPGPVAEFVQVF